MKYRSLIFVLGVCALCFVAANCSDGSDESNPGPSNMCQKEISLRQMDIMEDDTFDLGPYLQNPTQTGIVVKWRTLEETDGTVVYGEGDALDMESSHEGSATIHEVQLENLKPDTRYSYKVISGAVESSVHHLYTAVKENQGFRFTVWGDNQNGPDTFRQILSAMAGQGPHFFLGVGDLVQEGKDEPLWKEQLFDPGRKFFHELPFFTAIGNHERNADILYELYAMPPNGNEGVRATNQSFTYGNAFFLIVDTNMVFFSPMEGVETDVSQWIKDQMHSEAAQNATWRIALAHEPGYSESWGNGSCHNDGNKYVRNYLLPDLEEAQFHVYLSGHTHNYERGMENGMLHMITGGGGGSLDAWCRDWVQTRVAHHVHHYLTIEAGCDTLRIGAYDLDGAEFDWVTLKSDEYGAIVDEGPMENIPDPVMNDDSPTLTE